VSNNLNASFHVSNISKLDYHLIYGNNRTDERDVKEGNPFPNIKEILILSAPKIRDDLWRMEHFRQTKADSDLLSANVNKYRQFLGKMLKVYKRKHFSSHFFYLIQNIAICKFWQTKRIRKELGTEVSTAFNEFCNMRLPPDPGHEGVWKHVTGIQYTKEDPALVALINRFDESGYTPLRTNVIPGYNYRMKFGKAVEGDLDYDGVTEKPGPKSKKPLKFELDDLPRLKLDLNENGEPVVRTESQIQK